MVEIKKGTTGNDNISNDKEYVIIYGYAGNDTIKNSAVQLQNVTISGGDGKDYIYNETSKTSSRPFFLNVSIDGGLFVVQ